MKSLKYIFIIAVVIIACSTFKDCACGGKKTPAEPTTVTGSTPIVKPENVAVSELPKLSKPKNGQNLSNKPDYTEVFREALDDAIKKAERDREAFAKEKDSLKRAAMYANAIAPRLFTHTFNETDLTATVSGISSGPVEALKIDYTVTHPTPQKYYSIMADGKVGVNTELNAGLWYAGASVINDGKEVYSGGVTSVGDQKYITLGYSTRLFKIKKKEK